MRVSTSDYMLGENSSSVLIFKSGAWKTHVHTPIYVYICIDVSTSIGKPMSWVFENL